MCRKMHTIRIRIMMIITITIIMIMIMIMIMIIIIMLKQPPVEILQSITGPSYHISEVAPAPSCMSTWSVIPD